MTRSLLDGAEIRYNGAELLADQQPEAATGRRRQADQGVQGHSGLLVCLGRGEPTVVIVGIIKAHLAGAGYRGSGGRTW